MNKDLRFFTNTDEDSLYQRFTQTLRDAQYFDVLVGYFRSSGFYRLYKDLEKTEKIRILVGLNVDKKTYDLYEQSQKELDFQSQERKKESYAEQLQQEFYQCQDSKEIEIASNKFIQFLKSGKLELRMHASNNLHAKIYITRFNEGAMDFGRVVTGSSNFSENGLYAQQEFNVELKYRADVDFALERFEKLWEEAIDLKDIHIQTVEKKTWLNDTITPYELYLKFLYEYFKEDLEAEDTKQGDLPNDYMDLEYQRQAVVSAKKILDCYNGVLLSDVVGLGKTFITARLLKILPEKRTLIICPPVLKNYWQETLKDFSLSYKIDIESLGMIEKLLEDHQEYEYIIIDEAHRFRNEKSKTYAFLHQICKNKKVILLSATPLNNKLDDIKALVKLFQEENNCTIPGLKSLKEFFWGFEKRLAEYEKNSPEYLEELQLISEKIRDRLLKHIMIRRTRTEIRKYFKKDLEKQNLSFPDIAEPKQIIYSFPQDIENVFDKTLANIKKLSYSRYTPHIYLKKQAVAFEETHEKNLRGFIKTILVKRLESSFYAFKKSISRFEKSYQKFIAMYENGTVWISKKVDVYDLLENDNEDKLEELFNQKNAQKFESKEFNPNFKKHLEKDLAILQEIKKDWEYISYDPKIDNFIQSLKNEEILKNSKIIIFSESKETVSYLYEKLEKHFPKSVLSFASDGGFFNGEKRSVHDLRELILRNYQPKHKKSEDQVKILVTSDILAEGISLHRCNILINYDLPWNPTRILQRVGRINRVGTQHSTINIFNIFPTKQADDEIDLKNNIISKIQTFHNTLGEDAKYLSDEEVVDVHQLFDTLTKEKIFADEDEKEEQNDLYYLDVIKNVKEKQAGLFERIKRLPKKSRSAKFANNLEQNSVLTFFRKGALKTFALASQKNDSKELTFLQAVKYLECFDKERKSKIGDDFFELLDKNRQYIVDKTGYHISLKPKGRSNEKKLLDYLKALTNRSEYSSEDKNYLESLTKALTNGALPYDLIKLALKETKENLNEPLLIIKSLRKIIPQEYTVEKKENQKDHQTEVILNEYLTKKEIAK